MLLEIIKNLDLLDEFRLSQTCRAIRGFAQRDWKLALHRLSHTEQVEFLTGLAYTLPNHWVCGLCGKLHEIDKQDIPRASYHEPPIVCRPKNRLTFDLYYSLQHNHIQLALKLIRMGPVNQEYLEKIISPVTIQTNMLRSTQVQLHHCATPMIIGERFFLQVEREFTADPALLTPSRFSWEDVCPHLDATFHRKFSQNIYLAFESLGLEFTGHCERCPTDYSILITTGKVRISSWHDFGPYSSPLHEQWRVHLCCKRVLNNAAPTVYRNPGSIRDTYLKGIVNKRTTKV